MRRPSTDSRKSNLFLLSAALLVVLLQSAIVLPVIAEAAPQAEPEHESEFCEVLHRFNAEKKISDSGVRARVEGEYGEPSDVDRRRTWNIETACREFLLAVPLWADVSPPILTQKAETRFEDTMGGTWSFRIGGDGKVEGVTLTSQDGTTSEMMRLGDPRTYD